MTNNGVTADMSKDNKAAPSLGAEHSYGQPPPSTGGTPGKGPTQADWALAAEPSGRLRSPVVYKHADTKENALFNTYQSDKVMFPD